MVAVVPPTTDTVLRLEAASTVAVKLFGSWAVSSM